MEELDFSLAENSPAEGYGCRIFSPGRSEADTKINYSDIRHYNYLREVQEVSGEITEDTFWQADTILVVGDLTVNENVNLRIAAGVRIEFTDYYKILVQGSVLADGEADNRIIFTSTDHESFTLNASHRAAWNGIRYLFTSAVQDSSFFRYCIFEYAKSTSDTLQAGAVLSLNKFSKVRIENCIFRNNLADRGGVISCRTMSQPEIINNLFHDNYCLLIGSVFYNEYSYPVLINNTLSENYSINEDMWIPSCTITNYFSKPLLINNIIWGNETEYFVGGEIFEPRPYRFRANDIDQDLGHENLYQDPELAVEWSLNFNSPCIDAGEESGYLPVTDLAGNERVNGNSIDLGCYEFQISSTDEVVEFVNDLSVYPNPFNPEVNISFQLFEPEYVNLDIYNLRGQKIWSSGSTYKLSGKHKMCWNGKNKRGKQAASGVYIFRLNCGGKSDEIKAILLK